MKDGAPHKRIMFFKKEPSQKKNGIDNVLVVNKPFSDRDDEFD